jgi:ferric-dicitrate binding protein FerR (iron transport regulator)
MRARILEVRADGCFADLAEAAAEPRFAFALTLEGLAYLETHAMPKPGLIDLSALRGGEPMNERQRRRRRIRAVAATLAVGGAALFAWLFVAAILVAAAALGAPR